MVGATIRDTQRVMSGTNHETDWMRVVAEQSLNVSKAALEGFLTSARKTSGTIEHQASGIRERSISLAAESVSEHLQFRSAGRARQGAAGISSASR